MWQFFTRSVQEARRELDRDGGATQRVLATKLGVALGMTNLYLKRLARKGYIKVTTTPRSRIRYLLTPQGCTEKSRLTYRHKLGKQAEQ
ncbi:MAG: winged helix-turn-helix transcriptional regulator [Nitrospira sp.]|nr:winged helix-turn-helix transcriptional regulator [Nitrospira sp.]